MYVTTHTKDKGHVHVTLERGSHPGTWEVRHEQGSMWCVRTPEGQEHLLDDSDPWIGELEDELRRLNELIAGRAVEEALLLESRTPPRQPHPAHSAAYADAHAHAPVR